MSTRPNDDLLDRLVRLLQLHATDEEQHRRARLVVGMTMATAIWAPIFSGIYGWLGHSEAAIAALIATFVLLAVPVVLRTTRSVTAGGHTLLAVGFGTFVTIAWFTGGFDAPVMTWMVLLPLVAALGLGMRASVGWGIVALLAASLLWVSHLVGWNPYPDLDRPQLRAIGLPSLIALLVVISTIGWLFDYTRARTHRRETALRDDLAAALGRAEDVDREKTRMLANLAYEVRQPLHSVSGLTELLLDTPLTPVQSEYTHAARRAADEIVSALQHIEEAAQISSGLLILWKSAFDLREVVEDIAPVEAATAQKKGLELVVRFDPDSPRHVVTDSARIRQALSFLAANAVARTVAGHVLVSVRATDIRRDSASYRFEVCDTRPRVDATRSSPDHDPPHHDHTGLGVAVARQLIELLGGQLNQTYEDGVGFCRDFTLNVALDHGEHTSSLIQPDRMGRRVLVVDDMALTRSVLLDEFVAWQLRCDEASSAAEAVQLLEAAAHGDDPYLVAFVDSELAVPGDRSLADTLGAVSGAPPLVLLVPFGGVSARQDDQILRVSKPVRASRLPDLIAHALAPPDRGGDAREEPGEAC